MMRISRQILSRFISTPSDDSALRRLLDEAGLEVKRVESVMLGDELHTVFDLEILANRGDHYCYVGVAREIHGRTGGRLVLPESEVLEIGSSSIIRAIESELCMYYSATPLEIAPPVGPLPKETLLPVAAAGIHSISAIVDVSNLVNVELGQPTHIFDADLIVGGVTVRISRAGETALPLFAERPVKLPEGTLVIADAEKILAIAGVIGCQESRVTAESRHLLVESAVFDPVSVRLAARRMGMRTNSSIRFERGADPDLVLTGAGRVVWLLERYCNAKRIGKTALHAPANAPERVLKLDPVAARTFLGTYLTAGEMAERLARYGFAVSGNSALHVKVPPGRMWDVEVVADLYEELAKSIGYDAVPSILPPVNLGSLPSEWEQRKSSISHILCGEGFYEVFTDSFYGRDSLAMLGLEAQHPLNEHVQVLGALDKGHSLLKNNALIQVVDALAQNLRMSESEIKLFEWARIFRPSASAANGICEERELLVAGCSGHSRAPNWAEETLPADAWYLKGLVRETAIALRLPLNVGARDPRHLLSSLLHPGRQASITLAGRTIGILGEIHPRVVELAGIKRAAARPCYLEIETAALQMASETSKFCEPPSQPPTIRHLAFTLPFGVEAEEVSSLIRAAAPAWLDHVDIIDVFEHAEGVRPSRTLTFELAWSNAEKTRSAEELNSAAEALIEKVGQSLAHRGVKLR